jgi:hypothetical protein
MTTQWLQRDSTGYNRTQNIRKPYILCVVWPHRGNETGRATTFYQVVYVYTACGLWKTRFRRDERLRFTRSYTYIPHAVCERLVLGCALYSSLCVGYGVFTKQRSIERASDEVKKAEKRRNGESRTRIEALKRLGLRRREKRRKRGKKRGKRREKFLKKKKFRCETKFCRQQWKFTPWGLFLQFFEKPCVNQYANEFSRCNLSRNIRKSKKNGAL